MKKIYILLFFTLFKCFYTQKPVIFNIEFSSKTVNENLELTMLVTVNSQSPVNWINSSFNGPSGNIYGGSYGVTFIKDGPTNNWKYTRTDTVKGTSPNGVYYYSGISVSNEAVFKSDEW